ncbi:class I SAM-dependent methyltransferase [Thalassotalea sp. G2M2-11]|uniref:class I SAM-dependent methyltransferase n=1 Tax=Thalassotalea sp. G2M2-11 TaxID=2787627 RepID=UPI0019D12E27|nr:class I SAM-dependent methyltransferase [Thalassotalea sp. G2M2-11]
MIDHIKQHLLTADLGECQRVFHGRGHAYPGLAHINVDWFEPVLLITLYQEVEQVWLNEQVEQLKHLFAHCRSIQVQHRYQKYAPIEVVFGEQIVNLVASEQQLKFNIQLGKAQNSGLFLDMANGRQWLRQHSEGKNILNLFAYTCAFSVAALAGGAKQVVNIDMAKASLAKGRENHKLNQQNLAKVKFEGVDIFKSYGRLKKYGPYDILVCDPPSFQKGSVNIERDYQKIIRRIPQLMKPEAQLMLCLNSPDLTEDFLLEEVARECPNCIYQGKIANPDVFKEAKAGKGLKVLLFKYLG